MVAHITPAGLADEWQWPSQAIGICTQSVGACAHHVPGCASQRKGLALLTGGGAPWLVPPSRGPAQPPADVWEL